MITLGPTPKAVVDALTVRGGRPIVVGGAVRDALLGLEAGDLDIEVYHLDVDAVASALEAGQLGVHAVGRAFGVLKATGPDGVTVDVALPRRENKEGRGHRGFVVTPDPAMPFAEAAARRDFTINALGWDPVGNELLDPHGGEEDLERRVLRHVGPAFAEDPLRVLRGVQLAARFELDAASETVTLCRALRDEYVELAAERVWAEWWKWATLARSPSRGLTLLAQCSWRALYPELEALEGCAQDPEWHPEGDVWTHTLLVCDAAAAIAERDALEPEARGVLLLAALTHDLGKPATSFVDQDGRVRSPGHAQASETYAAFLHSIGAPAALCRRVIALDECHLDHLGFQGTARAIRRLARRLGEKGGETIESLLRLVEADANGRPPLPGGLPDAARRLKERAEEIRLADAVPQRILLGRHLLVEGHAPGPALGVLLDAAYEAQLDGHFDTLEGALAWVRSQGEG